MGLSLEQERLLEEIELTDLPVFVTGGAGTGKSTVLREYVRRLEESGNEVVVCAPTGIAALNVNGVTAHSLFGLSIKQIVGPPDGFSKKNSEYFQSLDTLVIDEVSMLRVDYFDAIDRALRYHRGSDVPFGGVKVVLFGDAYQLPPVVTKEDIQASEKSKRTWSQYGQHPFFFSSMVMHEAKVRILQLTEVHRYGEDKQFVEILNRVRIGRATEEDVIALNEGAAYESHSQTAVQLYGKNVSVDEANDAKLRRLGKSISSFPAKWIPNLELRGTALRLIDPYYNFRESVPQVLHVAIGAKVIFLRNDQAKRWVNGSQGEVLRISKDRLEVKLDNDSVVAVEPIDFEIRELVDFGMGDKKRLIYTGITGWLRHFPLRLGWAITVHKSQGLTLDSASIAFEDEFFEPGQAYVALSRVRGLGSLHFQSEVQLKDFFSPPIDVTMFMKNAEHYPFQEFHSKRLATSTRDDLLKKFLQDEQVSEELFRAKLAVWISSRGPNSPYKNSGQFEEALKTLVESSTGPELKKAKFWLREILEFEI